MDLQLKAYFGICSNVCIPASAELSLTIPPGGNTANQPAIAKALRAVPAKSVAGLKVKSAGAREHDNKVILDLKIDASRSGDLAVFVEGPGDYYFTTPKPMPGGSDNARGYVLNVDGAKAASELSGAPIVVTVVQGELSLEQKMILE